MNQSDGLKVKLPVSVMMSILTKPAKGEEWTRNAAREYAHREIKKLFPEMGTWEQQGVSK